LKRKVNYSRFLVSNLGWNRHRGRTMGSQGTCHISRTTYHRVAQSDAMARRAPSYYETAPHVNDPVVHLKVTIDCIVVCISAVAHQLEAILSHRRRSAYSVPLLHNGAPPIFLPLMRTDLLLSVEESRRASSQSTTRYRHMTTYLVSCYHATIHLIRALLASPMRFSVAPEHLSR